MSTELETPVFDKTKPYGVNMGEGKINTLDQNGLLYDGLTELVLDSMDAEKYCIPTGAPFSKIKSTQERIQDAISTIRASGAVDPDTLSKFDKMFRNMLLDDKPGDSGTQTTPASGLRRTKRLGEEG